MDVTFKRIPQGSSLCPFIFNIIMNNIFYFIELCDLTTCVDANTLDMIRNALDLVLNVLQQYSENAVNLFNLLLKNFMQVHSSKS